MLNLPTDPDLLEALIYALACQGEERDKALKDIVLTIFKHDSSTARRVMMEISPANRVFAWLPVCQSTMDAADIDAGMNSVSLYVPPTPVEDDDDLVSITSDELRIFFQVLKACVHRNWPAAREIASGLDHDLLYLDALTVIARVSRLPEDESAMNQLEAEIEADPEALTAMLMGSVSSFSVPPPDRAYLRKTRSDRLKRLITLNAPPVIISNVICTLAEAGGVDEALRAAAEVEMEGVEDLYPQSLAIGYAVNGDLPNARKYAAQLTSPVLRSRAFIQIYAATKMAG